MDITLSVGQIMTKELVSVKASDAVSSAIGAMTEHNIGCVIVTKDGKPEGIITERDILKRVCPERLCTQGITAGEAMSKPIIHIGSDAGIGQASALMTQKGIRRLLVLENGRTVGIVTQKDVMKATLNIFMTLASL